MEILVEKLLERSKKQLINFFYNRAVSRPTSVMVLGCIATTGVDSLHFCRDKIKAQEDI